MDSGADPDPVPITPSLLADLQAGLLDDATAARVRRQARTDPEAARMLADLDTVRRELAELGSDDRSAPEVPAAVTARVGAALRMAPHPRSQVTGHTVGRPRLTRMQWVVLAIGICAAAAAAVVGALMLTSDRRPAFPSGPTASQITVGQPPGTGFPLTDAELRAALSEPQDLGSLADPLRRASCLTGLGYSPTLPVLGGRPLDVPGRRGVLLLVPGADAGQIDAVLVEPSCSAAHTGLLAQKTLARQ